MFPAQVIVLYPGEYIQFVSWILLEHENHVVGVVERGTLVVELLNITIDRTSEGSNVGRFTIDKFCDLEDTRTEMV